MTVEREGSEIIRFQCNMCRTNKEYEDVDFSEAWPDARREGWTYFKIGTVGNHACPSCAKKLGG